MKPVALCKLILGEIDNGTLPFYRNILLDEPLSAIRDPIWIAAATVARKLDGKGQDAILALMRQAAIDASSTLLGAIDGSTVSTRATHLDPPRRCPSAFPRRDPAMRQQLSQSAVGPGGQFGENIFEVRPGVVAVELGGFDQAHQNGGALARLLGAYE